MRNMSTKLTFLQVSVILFTGGSQSLSWGVPEGAPLPGGVSIQGGLCPGGLCHGDPPYGNERAVRILLKCILVINNVLSLFGAIH